MEPLARANDCLVFSFLQKGGPNKMRSKSSNFSVGRSSSEENARESVLKFFVLHEIFGTWLGSIDKDLQIKPIKKTFV
jgi:hypothetical protein